MEYYSVTPIPNLVIDSTLHFDDFNIYKTISKQKLENEFNLDFEILSYFEKQIWENSPIYVRKFSLSEPHDNLQNAFDSAKTHTYHFINILALFKPSIIFIDRGPIWVCPTKKVINGETGKWDLPKLLEVRYLDKFKLKTEEFNELKLFFDKCYTYFSSQIRTDLDKYIENSYYCFSKTRQNIQPYDRLIFLNMLLESLVGAGQELSYRISHRCATILGKDSEERGKIFNKLKDYYKQRSKILHGERLPISNSDLNHLGEIGRAMILRFVSISNSKYVTKRQELMDKLDEAVVNDVLRIEITNRARELFLQCSDPQLSIEFDLR